MNLKLNSENSFRCKSPPQISSKSVIRKKWMRKLLAMTVPVGKATYNLTWAICGLWLYNWLHTYLWRSGYNESFVSAYSENPLCSGRHPRRANGCPPPRAAQARTLSGSKPWSQTLPVQTSDEPDSEVCLGRRNCRQTKRLKELRVFGRKTKGVSKSFRTGRLERELQMVQLSATSCSCIAILWVRLVSFAAITLWKTQQRVIPKVCILLSTQSGKFWISPRMSNHLEQGVSMFCFPMLLKIKNRNSL
jgi:hypothetical protein